VDVWGSGNPPVCPVDDGHLMTFEAQYASPCEECPFPIKIGDPIVLTYNDSTDETYWKHQECPKEKPAKFEGTTSEQMGF